MFLCRATGMSENVLLPQFARAPGWIMIHTDMTRQRRQRIFFWRHGEVLVVFESDRIQLRGSVPKICWDPHRLAIRQLFCMRPSKFLGTPSFTTETAAAVAAESVGSPWDIPRASTPLAPLVPLAPSPPWAWPVAPASGVPFCSPIVDWTMTSVAVSLWVLDWALDWADWALVVESARPATGSQPPSKWLGWGRQWPCRSNPPGTTTPVVGCRWCAPVHGWQSPTASNRLSFLARRGGT